MLVQHFQMLARYNTLANRRLYESSYMVLQRISTKRCGLREYSTFAWIIEGMLTRAGFEIEQVDYPTPESAQYVCRKSQTKTD